MVILLGLGIFPPFAMFSFSFPEGSMWLGGGKTDETYPVNWHRLVSGSLVCNRRACSERKRGL